MSKAKRVWGAALAGWLAMTGAIAMPVRAQERQERRQDEPPPRQDREDRRDDKRDDKRDDRRDDKRDDKRDDRRDDRRDRDVRDRDDRRDDRRDRDVRDRDERRDDRRDRDVRDRDDRRDDRREGDVRDREGAPSREARHTRTLRAKSVLGSKVSIRGDVAIGTVDDIIFTDDGYVDYVVVLNEGKLRLVPWEAAKFNFDRHTASVDIAQERYNEVPTFTSNQWPDVYAPAYRQKIYGYYGLRPGQERRIERREGVPRR